MGTVATVLAGCCLHVIPRDEGAAMNAGDLIETQQLRLICVLEAVQSKEVEVELIRILDQLTDLESQRHRSVRSTATLDALNYVRTATLPSAMGSLRCSSIRMGF